MARQATCPSSGKWMRWWDTKHFRDTDKEPQPLDPEFKPNLWITLARQRHAIRKASTVEDTEMFYLTKAY